MTKLQFASFNTNGLNNPVKRTACLDLLRRHKVDVAFRQESHLRRNDVSRFSNKTYYVAASSSFTSKTRGSLVVLRRTLSFTILESYGDGDGRVSYIKTILAGRKVAFVSIYAPNVFDSEFFIHLTDLLSSILEFSLILGADMNAVVNPTLDRSCCLNQPSLCFLSLFK